MTTPARSVIVNAPADRLTAARDRLAALLARYEAVKRASVEGQADAPALASRVNVELDDADHALGQAQDSIIARDKRGAAYHLERALTCLNTAYALLHPEEEPLC